MTTSPPDLVPALMLNEYAYCPRLAYLEWVQGEFADSPDTLDGRFQHRRVDRPSGNLPILDDDDGNVVPPDAEKIHARSVMPSDETLGAIARIDLVEAQGPQATPVDYQRGAVPDTPEQSYEPERVQLCLQGLLLRANGYQCREGILYFAASKRQVTIPFTDALVQRTTELLNQSREMAGRGEIPPPLEDSPKCPRCSLVGICLPDEVTFLQGSRRVAHPDDVRRLTPARDDALPVYVLTQGATAGKSGDNLTISAQSRRPAAGRFGPVGVRQRADHRPGHPRTAGPGHHRMPFHLRRLAQRRNRHYVPQKRRTAHRPVPNRRRRRSLPVHRPRHRNRQAAQQPRNAAAQPPRTRRPPKDPVNAILSLLYSMMIRQALALSMATGFDPYMSFYHQPKHGRPALALDLAEEFRPTLADSAALTLINNGKLKADDFIHRSGATALTRNGRRTVIHAFERRMDTLITHPLFHYTISYRRIMEVQARLLGRHLLGELKKYPAFTTR